MLTPRRVAIDTEAQTVTIEWADAPPSVLGFDALRRACPCVNCRERREAETSFPTGPWTDVQAETVGGYGLRLDWDDGHNDGIFTWQRLHAMGNEAD
jgi:DUF971 family protein